MGRPAGSVNKPRRQLIALLQEKYPGYDPVLSMADMAMDKDNSIELRASMHKEVAQYLRPKLRAIELQLEGQVNATIGWSDPHRVQSEAPTSEPA